MKSSILRKIFIADMYLNFGIAIFLTLFPVKFQSLIVFIPEFPNYVIMAVGIGQGLFASWQAYASKKMSKNDYKFASIMALWPFAALTIILIVYNSVIYLIPKIVMWIGNIYMLILGIEYWKKGK